MMEDNNKNIYESLIAENEDLKETVKNLTNELNNAKAIIQETSIEDYFVKKYTEKHEVVLQKHLIKINNNLDSVNKDLDALRIEEANIDEMVKNDATYASSIDHFNNVVEINNQELIKKRKELEEITQLYSDRQDLLKKATLGYYNTILKSMNPISEPDVIMANVEFVMHQLDIELYDLIIECRNLGFKKNILENEYQTLFASTTAENATLQQNVKDLESKIQNKTINDIINEINVLQSKVQKLVTLKKELQKSFKTIKNKDIKELIDKITYLKVCNKKVEDISIICDKMIDEKITYLESKEVFQQLQTFKEIELERLCKQKDELDVLKKEYDELKKQENLQYNVYYDASKNIDKIVEFIDNVDLIINENQKFHDVIASYKAYSSEEAKVKQEFDSVTTICEKLKQTITEKLATITKESIIKELTDQLKKANEHKNSLGETLRNVHDELALLENAKDNISLIRVYRDKEYAEARLPKMYEALHNLKVKLQETKTALKTYEDKLIPYEDINNQIENIKYELNN